VIIKGCSLRTRSYVGQPQKLEIRKDELSNTVTTVPKDFMLAIIEDSKSGDDLLNELNLKDKKGVKLVRKHEDNYSIVKDEKDINEEDTYFIIREMTNKEAFRLMGFDDEDYEKAKMAVNGKLYKGKNKSKTRLYKMAGNGIVVDVCEAIFEQLLPEYIK
jgi:site-specific DNA-cytosine methylase